MRCPVRLSAYAPAQAICLRLRPKSAYALAMRCPVLLCACGTEVGCGGSRGRGAGRGDGNALCHRGT
eukprot:543812-Rhodomonas_salina.1